MVRPPSLLANKFKSWRRGFNKKSKGTVKYQLRSLERILVKASTKEQRSKIEQRVQELKQEQECKVAHEMERSNAKKSHGTRFLERQRLTRLLKKTDAKDEETHYRLALDLIYVGHYPHDKNYLKIFRHGERCIDCRRIIFKRSKVRTRILNDLSSTDHLDWIAQSLYDIMPKSWSIEDERRIFGEKDDVPVVKNDTRFGGCWTESHKRLLRAAESEESEAHPCQRDDDNTSSTHSRSLNRHSPYLGGGIFKVTPLSVEANGDDCASSVSDDSQNQSTSSSSSDAFSSLDVRPELDTFPSDNQKIDTLPTAHTPLDETCTCSDDYNNNDRDSDDDDDDVDDFLIAPPCNTTAFSAFAKAPLARSLNTIRGDKSQGWGSQRRRAGAGYLSKRR